MRELPHIRQLISSPTQRHGQTSKPRNDPYFWPFHNTILAACFSLLDIGLNERFEVIFDNNVIFGPRARIWYPVMREVVRFREPEAFKIMPIDAKFDLDEDFMPLQAADLFAWCIRNATNSPDDKQFEWILDELSNVAQSHYSQYYDRERMEAVTTEAIRNLREGLVPTEVVDKYLEILGMLT